MLDVACGGGRHIVALAQKGYQCTGQDFTPERVKMAMGRASRLKASVRLRKGDATKLDYESEFDAVLALNILFLLPSDEDTQKCVFGAYRALRPGGVFVCNIFNALAGGKSEARKLMNHEYLVAERRGRGIRITRIERLKEYDPVLGVGWVRAADIVEAPDGRHVFRDEERFRFLTYWDIKHFLSGVGFRNMSHYPDWKFGPVKKPMAEQIVFVARK